MQRKDKKRIKSNPDTKPEPLSSASDYGDGNKTFLNSVIETDENIIIPKNIKHKPDHIVIKELQKTLVMPKENKDMNKKGKRSLIGKYWIFLFWLLLSLQVIYRLYISTNQATFVKGVEYFIYSLVFVLPMSLAISLIIAFLISMFLDEEGSK